jgi:hypothetical protein
MESPAEFRYVTADLSERSCDRRAKAAQILQITDSRSPSNIKRALEHGADRNGGPHRSQVPLGQQRTFFRESGQVHG